MNLPREAVLGQEMGICGYWWVSSQAVGAVHEAQAAVQRTVYLSTYAVWHEACGSQHVCSARAVRAGGESRRRPQLITDGREPR